MLRVAVLDRYPTFRYGVASMLTGAADIALVGTAADAAELSQLLRRTDPDVLLLDDQPGRFSLCLRVKTRSRARVLVCAGETSPRLSVTARLAGADGVVDRAAQPEDLVAAIRAVGAGARLLPPLRPRQQVDAASRLSEVDRPVFAMLLAGTSAADIARVSGLPAWAIEGRIARVIEAVA